MTSFPTFPEFFQALWGYEPFPWQTMLAERTAGGYWPQAIDLPTAAGKTACIDAAIYALAVQADKPLTDRTAPRRIWFVVDRRIVVDEAFDRASTIAEKLKEAPDGPLKTVADRLCRIGGTNRPLAVARLRGGFLRDDHWGRLPSQPAVITSTVDQLGSRLLFRGYGRRNLTASIFAGLAAHDSLILLDEAHCSVPFMQTLRAIETFRGKDWAEKPIVTPFAFAILSATPPADIPKENVFPGAEERERALDDPILHDRLSAKKPTELVTVKSPGDDGDPLVNEAVTRAMSYQSKDGKRRVGVIVNRVQTAKLIAEGLRKQVNDTADVVLLTGRIRPYERDHLVERWKPYLKAYGPAEPEKPIILVSTQCIEVGADFSFDALVTEAASLDALRQRFGRLNRMGTLADAPATILAREKDVQEGQDDPIYGKAISQCWALLYKNAVESENKKKKDKKKTIDFGFDALDGILSNVDDLTPCLAPRPDAPILLPAYLDLLCQTEPAPSVEPDISLFLHGKDRGIPEARVIWRADLAVDRSDLWTETVALCPPANGEMLSVPLYRLRAWLAKGSASDDTSGDVEGAAAPAESENALQESRRFLLWRGRDRSKVRYQPQAIKPNDVVVVPAEYGIGDLGQSEPGEALGAEKLDLWEFARQASGKPPALRINARIFEEWRSHPSIANLIAIAEDPAREADSVREALHAVIDADEETTAVPPRLREMIEKTRDGRIEEHPAGGIILFTRNDRHDAEPDMFADDDDLMSTVGGKAVSLARHTKSVERAVKGIARLCLPAEYADSLVRAARWHDVGKLDERFQYLLQQDDEPLAKSVSIPASPAQRRAAWEAAGLPKGFRHEMLSLQLAERFATLGVDDLALHLIASHHGYARPFAPVVLDPEPPDVHGSHAGVAVALDGEERARSVQPHHLASGIGDRFWRLTRLYGWWGLAYLEAALRLGDWYGSVVVLDEEPVDDMSVPTSITSTGFAGAQGTLESVVLAGIDGANPLGFLAALGTLVVLQRNSPSARLGWRRAATWQPILTGISAESKDALCDAIAEELRGNQVSDEAEYRRRIAYQVFSAAKRAVKDKKDEIKRRGVQGRQRTAVLESEVAPLENDMRVKRDAWLKTLKDSVPSEELALGKRIDCTDEEFHEYAASFIQNGRADGRRSIDLLAAFASDACIEKSGQVIATPFCFITGSGHQFFLDTVDKLMRVVSPERISATLFEPWSYSDKKFSMRWDPIEDCRYALTDHNPSDDESRTVWMANLLAYRALSLFSSAPGRRGLETIGWSRSDEFSWPIWSHPISPDAIRSLMLLPEWSAEKLDRKFQKACGVLALFRTRRVKVGSQRNQKINFSPSWSA